MSESARFWRRAFWLLLLLPLVPAIALQVLDWVAEAAGCFAAMGEPCRLGPLSAGHAFRFLVSAAVRTGEAFAFVGIPWGVLLVVAVHRGGGRRLWKAFFGLTVLGTFPFLGAVFPLERFAWSGCLPNEGGVGACLMFGVETGPDIHRLAVLPWMMMLSGGVAFAMFGVYALVAGVIAGRARLAGPASQ